MRVIRALRWQVIIGEYNASGPVDRHYMNQSLEEGGSLDFDLAQCPNQSITVSARGCQQTPDGDTSLSAL